MRVPGKKHVYARPRLHNESGSQRRNLLVERAKRVETPQPQIRDDLIVAGAPSVKLTGNVSHFLVQKSLYQGVNVLVCCLGFGAAREAVAHAIETPVQQPCLLGIQYPRILQCRHPCFAGANVLGPQATVDRKTVVERRQRLVGRRSKTPAPHLMRGGRRWMVAGVAIVGHTNAFSSDLRSSDASRSCKPYNRMNPPASAWSYTSSVSKVTCFAE